MSRLGGIAAHTLLLLGALFVLAPFIWAVSVSLRPPSEIFTPELRLIPQTLDAARNYSTALTRMPLLRFIANGAVVVALILIVQLAIMIPCAYALARLRFPGRSALFALVILGLMVPATALSLPHFILVSGAGLLDTYSALVLPWAVSVFGIFLLRQAFARVPQEMLEAARLDGLGEWSVLLRIALPQVLPVLSAFSIYSVVHHWNDLLWPSVVVKSIHMATPPYGVMLFVSDEAGSDYGALMAGAVIISAPMILAFLAAQRQFIAGFTATAHR